MAPAWAMATWLSALSVANIRKAPAAARRTGPSSLCSSRTSGAMAPARAIVTCFSYWPLEASPARLPRAAAASACVPASPSFSNLTNGATAPACAMTAWFLLCPAAKFRKAAAAALCVSTSASACTSFTSAGMAPALAMAACASAPPAPASAPTPIAANSRKLSSSSSSNFASGMATPDFRTARRSSGRPSATAMVSSRIAVRLSKGRPDRSISTQPAAAAAMPLPRCSLPWVPVPPPLPPKDRSGIATLVAAPALKEMPSLPSAVADTNLLPAVLPDPPASASAAAAAEAAASGPPCAAGVSPCRGSAEDGSAFAAPARMPAASVVADGWSAAACLLSGPKPPKAAASTLPCTGVGEEAGEAAVALLLWSPSTASPPGSRTRPPAAAPFSGSTQPPSPAVSRLPFQLFAATLSGCLPLPPSSVIQLASGKAAPTRSRTCCNVGRVDQVVTSGSDGQEVTPGNEGQEVTPKA
mmetsp:Transcript_80095/g.229893  ORF Transcript_80095/g.229893 Transcript_80095/m.229893 type:complete len:472 (-) Transcript_80095:198-1613(-)